jgi:hypothetical protein
MRRHGRATIVRDTVNQEQLRMVDLRRRNRRTASSGLHRSRQPMRSLWKMPFCGGEGPKVVQGTWPVTPSRLSLLELHDLRCIVRCCLL